MRKIATGPLTAISLLLGLCAATAQTFPSRNIRLIIPFPAGGPTDIIARVVGQSMSETLGQPVVIENRSGAGGVTGTDAVAKAAPDGYTLGLTSAGALAISPSLQRMPYQPTRDLIPITLVAKVPELLVVPGNSPAKNVADFIKMAQAKPGALNYASTGPGGMPNLAAELLKSIAKIEVVHVPYGGAAPAVTDLLGNRMDMMFADVPALLPHVQSGALRAIGIGSPARAKTLPDVPTMAEQGLPAVEAENWYGLVAPAGTPTDVVDKLHAAAVKALRSPDVQEKLVSQGADLIGDSPTEFTAYIEAETRKWAEVIRISGVKL
jgi:tripartite-type tricarboxylate transporter receptor subunit TctC